MNDFKRYNLYGQCVLSTMSVNDNILEVWSPAEVSRALMMDKCGSVEHKRYLSVLLSRFLEKGVYSERANGIMKVLLENGADPQFWATDGESLAQKAFKYADLEIALAILKHLPDIDASLDNDGGSALHMLVEHKNHLHMHHIMYRRPDLNFRDRKHQTPLYRAVRLGLLEKCVILLRAGADVNATDDEGYTPLHYACANMSSKHIIKMLLKFDAEVQGSHGEDGPLHLILKQYRPDIFDLLEDMLRRMVDPRVSNSEKKSPMQIMLNNRSYPTHVTKKIIKILVKFGAGLNTRYIDGNRSLHYYAKTELSIFEEHKHLMTFLMENGADINLLDSKDETVFDIYTRHEKVKQAEHLLKYLALKQLKGQFAFRDDLERSIFSSHVYGTYLTACRRELYRLLCYTFLDAQPFTLFDVLAQESDVMLARYLRFKPFRIFLKRFEFEAFEIYGADLRDNCLEGMMRHRAEVQGLQDFKRLFRGALDSNCLMHVFKYLDIQELRRIRFKMHPDSKDIPIGADHLRESLDRLF